MNINKKLIIILFILVAPLFGFGVSSAQEHSDEMSEETTNQTEQSTTGNEGLTLEERLQKRKDNLKTRLNNAQKLHIQGRCKAAQAHVSQIKEGLGNIRTRREKRYSNLLERLNNLTTRLKSHKVDTAELEKQITELEVKITAFQTDLAKYQEAVDDLADMNCTADPEGFQASLAEARTLRAQVVEDGKAIRAYLQGTIKPTLTNIRNQLDG